MSDSGELPATRYGLPSSVVGKIPEQSEIACCEGQGSRPGFLGVLPRNWNFRDRELERLFCVRFTPAAKEFLQNSCAPASEHPAAYFYPMIERWMI